MITTFNAGNYHSFCDEVSKNDDHLKMILQQYGYPPLWTRPAGFGTLVHMILEQQVSLASAMAAYTKLAGKCDEITPENILQLSDADLKACYFSRQKTGYVRSLATAFLSKQLDTADFDLRPDDEIWMILKQVKGIGDWTVDVYLIFAMQRADVFPAGDLAVVNAYKLVSQLPGPITREDIRLTAGAWKPYRSIAAMLLWHYYIKKRNITIPAY